MRHLSVVGLLIAILGVCPAFAQVHGPWITEITPTQQTLNAVASDGVSVYAVGTSGTLLRRDLADPIGMGSWTSINSGTSEELLDISCRPGVGCAASGWDVVLSNVSGSWTSVVDTGGQGRPYAPVWVGQEAVFYGEIGQATPLSFIHRRSFTGSSIGMSVGTSRLIVFCERAGELLGITRAGETLGFELTLASSTSYFLPPNPLRLTAATFSPTTCERTAQDPPRPSGAFAPLGPAPLGPGTLSGAYGVDELAAEFRLLILFSPLSPLIWMLPDAEISKIFDFGLGGVRRASSLGASQIDLLMIGSTADGIAASWRLTSDGQTVQVEGPQEAGQGFGTLIGLTVAERSANGGESVQIAVGTAGLVALRSGPAPLFSDGFETGNTSRWSFAQP